MYIDRAMNCILFPEASDQFLTFTDIKRYVVVLTTLQESHLLSEGHLIVVGDQAHNGGVVNKLYDGIRAVSGHSHA